MAVSRVPKPEPNEHDPYFSNYIDRVQSSDLLEDLERQAREIAELCGGLSEAQGDYRYAPGKWSIKEVLGHLIDTERVFGFRALWFARGAPTELPGFEQDDFVRIADFDGRSVESLISEFGHLRRSTVDLLSSFGDAEWDRSGISSGAPLSVRAIGYILAGHVIHHQEILEERYLRPLEQQ
jgi:hypothetical protein